MEHPRLHLSINLYIAVFPHVQKEKRHDSSNDSSIKRAHN